MRKGISDYRHATTPFTPGVLDALRRKGYRFVQVRGLTVEGHYDYIEPSRLVLIPFRELPAQPEDKDIYEPIDSELLLAWAYDKGNGVAVFV
jgi:hypothetical protein